jgi:hypothetical protein
MFTNYIKKAKELNSINLQNELGKKIFYNKWSVYISLVFHCVFTLLCVFIFYVNIKDSFLAFYFLFGAAIVLYGFNEIIGRFLIKNPIFILKDENLYYLKTQEWYNVYDFNFQDKFEGRYNLFLTYTMSDKEGNKIFSEKNWHLQNEDNLKDYIRYIQLKKLKKDRLNSNK